MMGCPFSAKVRDYIEKRGLQNKVIYRDIKKDANAARELIRLTNDNQVPCLVVDGIPMLECDRIITWMSKHLSTEAEDAEDAARAKSAA